MTIHEHVGIKGLMRRFRMCIGVPNADREHDKKELTKQSHAESHLHALSFLCHYVAILSCRSLDEQGNEISATWLDSAS
jgi:hypothetical protein